MNEVDVIVRARTQLIVNHAFFAAVVLKRPIEANPNIKTADCNPWGRIRYNPAFVDDLRLAQVVFLLAHECLHWMQDNFARRGDRNPKKWNRACDAVNNEILIEAKVGEFIEGGERYPGAQNMIPEDVYELLPDEDGDDDPDSGEGEPGGTGTDMTDDGQPLSDDDKAQIRAEIRTEVAQAAQAARQMGLMTKEMERLVEGILEVKVPWYDKLERFMDQLVKTDYSWTKPNRRFIGDGVYLPSISGRGLGEVAIVRDVSGSVSDREQQAFISHITTILETCQPTAIHIIDVATEITKALTLSLDEMPCDLSPSGTGGTDMRVGLRFVEDELPDVACCVLLTDGWTAWPDSMDVPTIVVTTDNPAPDCVGETIKIEVD